MTERTDRAGIPLPRPTLRSRLVTGTAFSFVSLVVGQGFALVTSILYARLLGPTNLGLFAIYTQLTALAASVASLGLSVPIARFVAQLRVQGADTVGRFVSTVLTMMVISTIAASIAIFGFAQEIGLLVYRSPDLAIMLQIAAGFLILDSLNLLAIAVLQGFQRIRFLSIAAVVIEAMTIPVMFVSLTLFGLIGAAVGGVVMSALGLFLLFGSTIRSLRKEGIRITLSFHRGPARQLVRYAAPLLGSVLIVKVALFFQTSFVAVNLGYDDVGLFRVASTVSRIIEFVPAAMTVPLLPAIAELYATVPTDQTRVKLNALLRMTSYIGAPIALAIAFGANSILSLLYGPIYIGAGPLAFVLVAAGYVNTIDNVATTSLLGEGRTGSLLVIDAMQAIVIVLGTVSLLGLFGLMGIGYASLVASLIYGLVILSFLAKTQRIELRAVIRAFVPGGVGFGLAAAVSSLDSFPPPIWLAGPIVGVCIVVGWVMMTPSERVLIKATARDLMRMGSR